MKKIFLFSILLQAIYFNLHAQPGALDPSFGTGGMVIVPYSQNQNTLGVGEGWSAAVQTDGKIVTAGYGYDYSINKQVFIITRHLANGSLDPSFSGDGIAYINPNTSGSTNEWSYTYGMAIAPDGKIVVTGYHEYYNGSSYNYTIPVVRVNPDGTPDNSFDGDGIVHLDLSTDVNYWERGWGIAVQNDSKIVINGISYNSVVGTNTMTVARLNANGTQDNSFNGNGVIRVNFGNYSEGYGIKIQPDGKIVASGLAYNYINSNNYYDFAVVRFNTDGTLDNSFDGDGKTLIDVGGYYDYGWDVDLQPNGKLVVAGYIYNYNNSGTNYYDVGVTRLNANGSLDNNFDGDGKKVIDLGSSYDIIRSVAVQPDGDILLGGYSNVYNGYNNNDKFAIIKLNEDGNLDNNFDGDGIGLYDFGYYAEAFDIALQNDGKIIAVGQASDNQGWGRAIARILNDALTYSLNCPGDQQLNTTANSCDATVNDIDPIVSPTDAIVNYKLEKNGIVIETGTGSISGKTFSSGVTTITYTLASDETITCSFTVTVNDEQAPTVTQPTDINVANAADECSAEVNFSGQATDNCTVTSLKYYLYYNTANQEEISSPKTFAVGSYVVTVVAKDAANNTTTKTFTIAVTDNQPPSITCPAPVTINASPGLCTGTTTLIPPTVTDNCNSFGNALSFGGGYVNVPNTAILNPFNEWTLETWVKRTNTGVQESLIEKYNQPANTYGYLLRILGNNKAQAGFDFGSFAGYFIEGSTTILPNTWYHLATTVNRATGVMKLYVNGVLDAQVTGMTGLPTIPNTASLKLGARGDDAATRLSNGGIMDEIRIWSVERTQAQIQLNMNNELSAQSGLVALYHLNQGIAGGNNTGLTTATDASGNGNNGSLISFALTGPTSNWVNGQGFGATVTNNAPVTYPKGNTNVTWTATDGNGNTATCIQVVTVVDNQPPVITCPLTGNTNRNTNAGVCTYTAMLTEFNAAATDNCTITSLTYELTGETTGTGTTLAGVVFNKGVTIVTWTASDGVTINATCSFTVTVNDKQDPIFTCPANQNVNLSNTCQLVVPDLVSGLTGSDNCGTVTFTQSPLAGASLASSHNQIHNVVITASDGNGNTQTCSVVLTGKDVTKPTFTCPDSQNVNLNGTCQLIVPNLISELTGSDNCGIVTFTQSPLAGASIASSHDQAHNVLITASDGNGNTQTCTVMLTGKDVTKPTFTCPYDRNVNLNGTCQFIVPNLIYGLTGNDNCGTVTFTQSPVAGASIATSHNQTHNVLITASDGNDNTQTCTVVLTGKDVTKPTFTCPYDRNVNLNGTCQLIVPNLIYGLTGNDNCGTVTFTQNPIAGASFASSHNQTYNVVITASDGNGNTESCTVVLTAKDVTLPVITCPSPKIISCDASILPANTGSATATDNCGGSPVITYSDVSGQDPNPSHAGYYNYVITRTWKAMDVATNTSTCNQTITVQDITKPMITCLADKLSVPFDFGQLYATIAIGTATATDNCAANANIAIAGTRSDNVVISNKQYPLGQTTVAWSATDPSDNSDGCTQTITVRKRNTTVTYTGDMTDSKICVQYSDIINLQAKLTDNEGLATPNNISGRAITFQLLSGATVLRSKTATTNASGVAVDTFKIEQAPGLYSVKTIFAGDSYFNGSSDQDNCEVKQEDAVLEYNGSQYFTTASATTMTGSISLAAAINDIDDGSDKRGDIRKAKATFRDGGPAGNILGSANLPVGLVNPGILTNGLSATTQNNITLNSNDASSGGKIYQVWVGASDHYTGADAGPTPVTLALPGQDFVTGGGHLVVTNSAGTYAGTPNSKMNFGFTMKWNKSGKNLQGNINIVFRKWQLYNNEWQWRVYQMKSNAINSMAVVEVGSNGQPVTATNPAAFRKAIINTKANLKDVTDPLNNIDLGGNHNLTLDAWDHITANGGVSDKISVTLMGATTNELLFSSSWISNATAAQTITGGNLNVRNGSASSNTSVNNSITRSGQMEVAVKEGLFVVKAYPNPTEHEFTLIVNSTLNEKIEIQLYDVIGRKIQTLSANANETIRFGERLKIGVYIAQVIQGNKKESIKLIKQ